MERIRKEMSNFESLLDEGAFVKRRKAEMLEQGRQEGIALGIVKGREEGKAEGEVVGLQEAVVSFIELRFPPLAELAHRKVPQVRKREQLDVLLRSVYTAPDEDAVRL